MKKILFPLFFFGGIFSAAAAKVAVDFSLTPQKIATFEISTAATPDFFFVKLPKIFSDFQILEKNKKCVFAPRKIPKILFCKKPDDEIFLKFAGKIAEKKSRGKMLFLEKFGKKRFFSRKTFFLFSKIPEKKVFFAPKKPSKKIFSPKKFPKKKIFEKRKIPKKREILLKKPVSKIIVAGKNDFRVVARAKFIAENSPIFLDEISGKLTGKIAAIDRVALFAADGETLAETGAIDAAGNFSFKKIDAAIAEGGEYFFLGVKTRRLFDGEIGGDFSAEFSAATARNFWNGRKISVEIAEKLSPIFSVARAKLIVEKIKNQNHFLKNGRVEALKIAFFPDGDGKIFVRKVFPIFSDGAFKIRAARLLVDGKLLAKIAGDHLTGENLLKIGDCGDEKCDENLFELSKKRVAIIEVDVQNLKTPSVLVVEIRQNGGKNGDDGVEWADENGDVFRWIDAGDRVETRIENALKTP